MNKKQLSERDICTKYITPALEKAGWDVATQIREEFPLTRGRIIVRGKLHTRARHKRADYVLFYKPNIPIAIIEAIARGQNRILLVMATGTGKTFTAFQIIWRLWKSKAKKRILFLADRNYNLDCKNPYEVEVNHRDPQELMAEYQQIVRQLEAAQTALKAELMACLGGKA